MKLGNPATVLLLQKLHCHPSDRNLLPLPRFVGVTSARCLLAFPCTWCTGKPRVPFQLLAVVYRFCRREPVSERLDQMVSDGHYSEESWIV